jgi:hypothetical protein
MVTKQEEQLNRYFEHTMSSSEEQNFLITVAASDEMRIAFRSQLELMKAVRSDKDALHAGMSGHPVAHVRYRTLAALGLSATAAMPLMDQELEREPALQTGASSSMLTSQAAAVGSGLSWLGNILRTPKLALTAGLALGILSTTAVVRLTSNEATPVPVVQSVTTTPSVVPMKSATNVPPETIPATNGLNNSSHSQGLAVHHATTSSVGIATLPASTNAAQNDIPEVSKSNVGSMHAKTHINRSNDSAAAK